MHFLAIKASWQLAMTLHQAGLFLPHLRWRSEGGAAVDILAAVKTEDWVDKMEF